MWLPSMHHEACVPCKMPIIPKHLHSFFLHNTSSQLQKPFVFIYEVSLDEQKRANPMCVNALSVSPAHMLKSSRVIMWTGSLCVRVQLMNLSNSVLVRYGEGPPPFTSEGSHIRQLENGCLMDCSKPTHTHSLAHTEHVWPQWRLRHSKPVDFLVFNKSNEKSLKPHYFISVVCVVRAW